MRPSVAVMVDVPREPNVCPVAAVAVLPLTVATAVFEEDQVTAEVKFCMLPSLNVPVAVNC